MKDDNILDMSNKSRLSADITYLMLKGGAYAALVVVAMLFFVLAFAAIGRALPEESRLAPDPINRPAPIMQTTADPAPADDDAMADDAEEIAPAD
jgi:hypothetical protein